jgi:hypothetical protein
MTPNTRALQIPVMPFLYIQDCGDTLCHRGFFRNYKAHGTTSIL